MSASSGPGPTARLLLLVLAVACGAGALRVSQAEALAWPWLAEWSRAHPDPSAFSTTEQAQLSRTLDEQRRDDAVLLLAGLAAGCAVLCLRPTLARGVGVPGAVLATGSVALGLVAAFASVRGQVQAARANRWTLGDDSLAALAGPHAAALREARARLGPDDAVLIAGTNQTLFNAAAWALDGQPLYPVLKDVPERLSLEDVRAFARTRPEGAGAPRRWLLDLGALDRGPAPTRPALIEIPP